MEESLKALLKKFPLYDEASKGKWENVPITTREDLSKWSLDKCPERPVFISTTSGTSSKPITVFHDNSSMDSKISRVLDLFKVLNSPENNLFLTFLGPFCITKKSAELALYKLGKTCISLEMPAEKNKILRDFLTNLKVSEGIIGTSGSIALLLKLKLPLKTKYAAIGGSLATKEFKNWVRASLGCVYINTYASNEFGVIAADLSGGDGELSVANSGLFLEIRDEENKIHEEGTGTLLITDYTNYSMPLIRYLIGDKVNLKRTNGKTTITILGRVDRFVKFDREARSIETINNTIKNILGNERFYLVFRNHEVTLYDYANLYISLEDESKETMLKNELNSLLGKTPRIIFTEKFMHAPNGKFLNFFDLRKGEGQAPKTNW